MNFSNISFEKYGLKAPVAIDTDEEIRFQTPAN
jgi:hypothetical protein